MDLATNMHLRRFGCLIRRINAGEVFQFAPAGFFVQAFGVALLGDVKWRVDVFDESVFADKLPCQLSLGFEGRDESGEDHKAGIAHEFGHFGDAADVFYAVFFGKTKISIQAMAHIVAI